MAVSCIEGPLFRDVTIIAAISRSLASGLLLICLYRPFQTREFEMTDFNLHTIESAPEASKPQLEHSQKVYGFVPNLHAEMAESPALLEAYRTIGGIFDSKTKLSPTERQIIAMTNNRLNGCEYCMAAHTSIMQSLKVPEDVIESLRDGTPIADPKLEALRVFAEKVNLQRGWLEDGDLETFLSAGYSKETVFEVIVGTAFKVLSNYTNHVASTPLDNAFAKNEWHANASST
jgi:uncharacterized peroxidase-related enzyme